jgi:hypothetical protein
MPSGRRGRAQPGPDGRWHPRGRAGENGAAGGAPSRKEATPRRDPGDCNAGRLPHRSLKRARRTSRLGYAQSMRPGNKTPREDEQGRCRSLGQRKGPATPLPERGRENAGAVTGLEQRNALARPLLPPDGVAGGNSPIQLPFFSLGLPFMRNTTGGLSRLQPLTPGGSDPTGSNIRRQDDFLDVNEEKVYNDS